MQNIEHFLLLTSVILFMCLPIVSAGTVGFFSQDWSYPASYLVYPRALDCVGQMVYFGSHNTFGFTNYLYAVNITNGQLKWWYNTTLPVNYVSNFTYNGNTYIIAATGGSVSLPSQSYVLALYTQKNATLWNSTNLNAPVQSLGTAGSDVSINEDVIAGLANGQVLRLSGSNGSLQWRYNCEGNITIGNVPNIVQLDNGSIAVGTSSLTTGQGYLYCFTKDGLPIWNYTSEISNPLREIKRFRTLNEIVAAFKDVIDVRNGTNGAEISQWPFNTTQHIAPFNVTQEITDILCIEDYTGDGFPDIVVGTEGGTGGFLMIINGRDATLTRGATQVSSYTLPYIQYMYFNDNLLNKTLAISIEDSSHQYYVCGVNASDLTVMKEFPVSGIFAPTNLVSIANSTNFTGNLLFSAGNVVYYVSGNEIVYSEFPSQIMVVVLILTIGFLLAISRREHPRKVE